MLMKILLAFTLLIGTAQAAIPSVDVVVGNYGSSCAHASWGTVLNIHERPLGAAWWRVHHRGPFSLQALHRASVRVGLPVVSTFSGDANFLERNSSAVVDWRGRFGGRHAVVFRGYRGNIAIISDPNEPSRLRAYRKAEFLRYWQWCGGRAVALQTGGAK